MKKKLKDEIEINRNKLTKMVENNEPYDKILKQSDLLDKLINQYNKASKK